MKRFTLLVILLMLTLGGIGGALSQNDDIRLGISDTGTRRISLALPPFRALSDRRTNQASEEISKTLWDDLAFSGVFNLVNPKFYSYVSGYSERRVRHKDWEGIGAESLVLGKVTAEGAKVVVDARLYNTLQEKMMAGKRYRGEPEISRKIAHRFANEVVQQFTGEPGIFQSRIAFVSQVGRAKEIFVMDYDGARIKKLTNNGSLNLNPSWSPDGKQIAFLSYRSGRPDLVILTSEGKLKQAFPQGKSQLNLAPDWSPDGKLLAFSSSRNGNADIFVLSIGSGKVRRITSSRAIDTSPSWSPSGREIAFVSDRSGTPQIYLMNADGSSVRRLTREGSWNDLPAWSPNGGLIAYASRIAGRFDIFIRDLETQESTRLTFDSGNNEDPRWSADGRHLVFSSDRAGNYDIYQMDGDGGRQRRITKGGNSYNPDWSR